MSQPSIVSYFNTRKRAAADDLVNRKNKVILIDPTDDNVAKLSAKNNGVKSTSAILHFGENVSQKNETVKQRKIPQTRSKRVVKRVEKTEAVPTKIVKFTLGGNLSPKKRTIINNASEKKLFESNANISNVDRGMLTPTKEQQIARAESAKLTIARKNLSLNEIKSKIFKSSKLNELKASLNKLQTLETSRQKSFNKNKELTSYESPSIKLNSENEQDVNDVLGKSLKQFDTIDLEVLSSPQKGHITPQHTSNQNILMSPKKTPTPKRLFSPMKASPTKQTPAYQKFQHLVECGLPTLQLPYKYRCLAETFKCLDTVCSMFYNRKETITMKKLKPAVQRMLRRNFTETNLAQIKYLFPDAYNFNQKKMLNAGSLTKYDYFQLVIIPNVTEKCETTTKPDEENIIKSGQHLTMNPQIMIARQQTFNRSLLEVVLTEHDKFLKTLNPPMNIPMAKITRWHPEFDLQSCPEIGRADLPQPLNVDKFSSAKDVLSTARNLFNCSTSMERIMERFDAKQQQNEKNIKPPEETKPIDPVATVLKDIPKSLLERIRLKQAAKALDAITRRPSQDIEASKYKRLPELARHLRNIFVTESKTVLELDIVLVKIENSYREKIARDFIKELLQIIGKEAPNNWLSFHHMRKTDFVKIRKDQNLNEVINALEIKAEEMER